MKDLATATALALIHIEHRSDDATQDDDIKALEDISACLINASRAEQDAVSEALIRLGFPGLVAGLGL